MQCPTLGCRFASQSPSGINPIHCLYKAFTGVLVMELVATNGTDLNDFSRGLDTSTPGILSPLRFDTTLGKSTSDLAGTAIDRQMEQLLTGEVLESVYSHLKQFASNPDFADKMNLIFGNSWNRSQMSNLVQDWQAGDFAHLPEIDVLTGVQLKGANAAFCGETNMIYVSSDFLTNNANNPSAIANVLLEEVGHAIDSRINARDAAGDEGDLFQRVVQGIELSSGELLALKTDHDHATIVLNGETLEIEMSRIAVETFKGRLYQSVRGTDNGVYTRSSADGVNWSSWVSNGKTLEAPELEVFNGRLYQSVRGMDDGVYARSSSDGINWSSWVGNGKTWSAPELEAFNGRLYQTVQGIDNGVYTRSTADGANWSSWVGNGATLETPELEAFNGRLYQSVRGTDNGVYTRSSADGINWSSWVSNGKTWDAPELEAFNDRLYQSVRGTNRDGLGDVVYTRSSVDGVNWSSWSGNGFTRSTPTLTVFNDRLHQTIEGTDSPYGKIYSRYSTNSTATAWSPWKEYGGLTNPDVFNGGLI
jgi:hypothetical protein